MRKPRGPGEGHCCTKAEALPGPLWGGEQAALEQRERWGDRRGSQH